MAGLSPGFFYEFFWGRAGVGLFFSGTIPFLLDARAVSSVGRASDS